MKIPRSFPIKLSCVLFPLAALGCDQGGEAQLGYSVLRTLPHDGGAYTQGLELYDGVFLESTGQYGSSTLRRVDVATGEVLAQVELPEDRFGEGIAVVDSQVIQLTWKAGVAYRYDARTLELSDSLSYEGEGWGLCFDGSRLYMSNGSGTLTIRNPETFEAEGELPVRRGGYSTRSLNELECLPGGDIYANVYQTDEIVRIDKFLGEVTGALDAYGLTLQAERSPDAGAVLNGIAYDAASGKFYLTGKLWRQLFEVEISER